MLEQAGAELGQAQLKIWFGGFCFVNLIEKMWFNVFDLVHLVLYILDILLGRFNFVDMISRFGLVNLIQ